MIFKPNEIQLWESLPEPSDRRLQSVLAQIKQDVSLHDIQMRLQSGVTTGYIPSWYRALTDTGQAVMFKSSYRYTDLNADGRTDLIYTGYPISYDKPSTVIWLNNRNTYQLIGQRSGLLYALRPGVQPSLITQEGQCCGNYVLRYDVVAMNMKLHSEEHPSFSVLESYTAFKNTYLPRGTTRLLNRRPFTITSDRVELRFSPVMRDQLDANFSQRERKKAFGNIIAIFRNGDQGEVLGRYTDTMSSGAWWLVAFKPQSLGSYNRFYNDRQAYRIGWIPADAASYSETSANME
jgi:hypothetical protein